MKVFALLFLVSLSARADLVVFMEPQSPTVTFGDLLQNPGSEAEIKADGPWMEASQWVKNEYSEPVEILSLNVIVKTPEGKSVSKRVAFKPFTMAGGESRSLPKYFLESIPVETTQTLDGTVTVEFKRGEMVDTRSINFKTH